MIPGKPAAGQGKAPRVARPVNAAATLYDTPAREIWQCPVLSSEGCEIGRAVGQIVEPAAWSVRYLVVLDNAARRCLLPATLVAGADEGCILCDIPAERAAMLACYTEPLERPEEEAAHAGVGCQPYWQERHMPIDR